MKRVDNIVKMGTRRKSSYECQKWKWSGKDYLDSFINRGETTTQWNESDTIGIQNSFVIPSILKFSDLADSFEEIMEGMKGTIEELCNGGQK